MIQLYFIFMRFYINFYKSMLKKIFFEKIPFKIDTYVLF
jgi:hypothetical protein